VNRPLLNYRGLHLDKKHLTITMTGKICRECAKCCRHFAFAKLSQPEIEALEDFTGLHSNMFANPIGTEGEGRFLKFRENGDCIFLNRDDGTYSCVVYEARSQVCRDYPSNQEQNETCYMNRNG
jgi:Fe-S-cluster containining protein